MLDIRENLVDILANSGFVADVSTYEELADHLIANGVTVGKPLTEFLHPEDAYPGLKEKYLVFKTDTGERVADCFVLRPAKDHAAVEALRGYAGATDNETLAEDIYNWVGKSAAVQRWIPVTERVPSDDVPSARYLCFWNGSIRVCKYWRTRKCFELMGKVVKVTHWMPLPEPPKEV